VAVRRKTWPDVFLPQNCAKPACCRWFGASVSYGKAKPGYNQHMRKNPALTRFVAASRAMGAAPVFAQTTKTTTIKG